MLIYLAGPMRSVPLFNFPAFMAAATRLRALGHTVLNPAEEDLRRGFNPAADPPDDPAVCMARDLPLVCASDAVAVLKGWESSQCAKHRAF